MKANRVKSVALLTAFSFLGKIVGALYKIVLVAIIGAVGIGYYQLAFPVFVFLFSLISSGMSTSLTVMVAENKDDPGKAYAVFCFANRLVFVLSLISGGILVAVAPFIAALQGNKIITPIYYVIAFLCVGVNLLNNCKAYLRGSENTGYYVIADSVEQICKFVFSVVLALLFIKKGVLVACVGVFVGIGCSAYLTLAVLFVLFFAKRKRSVPKKDILPEDKKRLINFSLLACVTTLILPAVQVVDSVIIVNLLQKAGESITNATILFGLSKGTVSALLNVANCILLPIEFLFLPSLVGIKGKDECAAISEKVINIVILVVTPIAAGLFFFSEEIFTLIYSSSLTASEILVAGKLLKIGSLGLVFSAIATMQNTMFQGVKKLQYPIFSLLIALVLKIVFEILLINKLSIYAVELSGVLYGLMLVLINFIFLLKEGYEVSAPINCAFMIVGVLFGYGARLFYNFWAKGVYSGVKFVLSVLIVFMVFVFVFAAIILVRQKKQKNSLRTLLKDE